MTKFDEFKMYIEKYNPSITPETVFGVFPALYIGSPLDSNPQKVLVKLENDFEIYAQVSYSYPFFTVPSVEWVSNNEDPLFCHIGFERGLFERPIILGYYFKKDKAVNILPEKYPREHVLLWENFEIRINDEDKTLHIKNNDNEQTIKIHETIDLGKLDSLEPAVLGEKLKTLIEKIVDDIGTVSGIASPAGPTGAIQTAPNWTSVAQGIKTEIETIFSANVKLD